MVYEICILCPLLLAVKGRNHVAFSDVRRLIAKDALEKDFVRLFPDSRKSIVNTLAAVLLRMAA